MGFHTTVRKSVLDEILATLEEEGKDGAEDLKAALLAAPGRFDAEAYCRRRHVCFR